MTVSSPKGRWFETLPLITRPESNLFRELLVVNFPYPFLRLTCLPLQPVVAESTKVSLETSTLPVQ